MALRLNPMQQIPAWQPVSGTAGLVTRAVTTQPAMPLSARGFCLGLWFSLTEEQGRSFLPWPCPCPVPPGADADPGSARWYPGGSRPLNPYPPQCFCDSALAFDVSLTGRRGQGQQVGSHRLEFTGKETRLGKAQTHSKLSGKWHSTQPHVLPCGWSGICHHNDKTTQRL